MALYSDQNARKPGQTYANKVAASDHSRRYCVLTFIFEAWLNTRLDLELPVRMVQSVGDAILLSVPTLELRQIIPDAADWQEEKT